MAAFGWACHALLVTRALAAVGGIDAKLVAERMMGYTDPKHRPSPQAYLALIDETAAKPGAANLLRASGQPYPFFLAHALQAPLEAFDELLGPPSDWQIEWKYDGIRAQVVRRATICGSGRAARISSPSVSPSSQRSKTVLRQVP